MPNPIDNPSTSCTAQLGNGVEYAEGPKEGGRKRSASVGSKGLRLYQGEELEQLGNAPENRRITSDYTELLESVVSERPRPRSVTGSKCPPETSETSKKFCSELLKSDIFGVEDSSGASPARETDKTEGSTAPGAEPIANLPEEVADAVAACLNVPDHPTLEDIHARLDVLHHLADGWGALAESNEAVRLTLELSLNELADMEAVARAEQGKGLPLESATPNVIRSLLPKDSPARPLFTDGVCTAVRMLADKTGLDAAELVEKLHALLRTSNLSDIKAKSALLEKWLPSIGMERSGKTSGPGNPALSSVSGVEGTPGTGKPDGTAALSDACDMIDLLFSDAYPEGYESALALKQALAPEGMQDDARLQHELMITRRALHSELCSIAPDKGRTGMLSPEKMMLHPDHLKSLLGTKGIDDAENGLACLIRRQADAIAKGLSDEMACDLESDAMKNFKMLHPSFVPEMKTAPPRKLYDLSPGDLAKFRLQASEHFIQMWDEATGIGGGVRALAHKDMYDSGLQKQIDENISRKMLRYSAGILGKSDEKEMSGGMRSSGHDLRHLLTDKHLSYIMQRDPHYQALRTLDSLAMALSGVIDPEQRPVSGGTKEELAEKTRMVDEGIRKNFKELLPKGGLREKALLSQLDKEITEISDYRDSRLKELKGVRRPFLRHMQALAEEPGKLQETRQRLDSYKSILNRYNAMKAGWNSVGAVLPHHRGEQRRVCESIIEINRLQNEIDKLQSSMLNGGTGAQLNDLTDMIQVRDTLRDQLTGLDPLRMRLGGTDGNRPSISDLRKLASRAEAVLYFRNGSDAEDLRSLTRVTKQIMVGEKEWTEKLGDAKKIYGEKTVSFMRSMVVAAILDVYGNARGGNGLMLSPEQFSPYSDAAKKEISERLKAWGVAEPEQGFFGVLRERVTSGMCRGETSLSKASIDAYAAIKAPDDMASASRARKTSEELARMDEKTRAIWHEKGLGGILDQFSSPGTSCTFSLDRDGKVTLYEGLSPSSMAETASVGLSATLGISESDSITLSSSLAGGFDVVMTGGIAANFNVNANAALGNKMDFDASGSMTMTTLGGAAVGVNFSSGVSQGVSLHFADKEKCLAFLNGLTTSGSVLRRKHEFTETAKRQNAREMQQYIDLCQDMRFQYGDTWSVSAFFGVSGPSARVVLPHVTGSFTLFAVGGSAGTSHGHTVTMNAHGFTEEFTSQTQLGIALTGPSLGATTNMVGKTLPGTEGIIDPETGAAGIGNPASISVASTPTWVLASAQRNTLEQKTSFSRTTAGNLTGETSRTSTLERRNLPLREGLIELGMTNGELRRLFADPGWAEDMEQAWNSMPGDGKASLSRTIRPEVLKKANILEADIRHAVQAGKQDELKKLRGEYEKLINDDSSYGDPVLVLTRLDGLMIAGLGNVGYEGRTFKDTMKGSAPTSLLGYSRSGMYIGTHSMVMSLERPKERTAPKGPAPSPSTGGGQPETGGANGTATGGSGPQQNNGPGQPAPGLESIREDFFGVNPREMLEGSEVLRGLDDEHRAHVFERVARRMDDAVFVEQTQLSSDKAEKVRGEIEAIAIAEATDQQRVEHCRRVLHDAEGYLADKFSSDPVFRELPDITCHGKSGLEAKKELCRELFERHLQERMHNAEVTLDEAYAHAIAVMKDLRPVDDPVGTKTKDHLEFGSFNDLTGETIVTQGDNTCFMMSLVNSLASTGKGLQYLQGLQAGTGTLKLDGPGKKGEVAIDPGDEPESFGPIEYTLGTELENQAGGFELGYQWQVDDMAHLLGLTELPEGTDSAIVMTGSQTVEPGGMELSGRTMMAGAGAALRNGNVCILFIGQQGTVDRGHYMAVTGTYEDGNGDFGVIVRDSEDGVKKKFSLARRQLGGSDVIQLDFFAIPDHA